MYALQDVQYRRWIVVMGDEVHERAIEPVHCARPGAAEAYCVRDDGVEDGLDVSRRARDHPKDLARRRLLLQRLGEIAITDLEFLEEADVLDGDDGLVGERLEERGLGVGEMARRLPREDDDQRRRVPLTQHRHAEYAPEAARPEAGERVVGIVLHVGDLDRLPSQDRPAARRSARRRHRKTLARPRSARGWSCRGPSTMDECAIEP